jgi:hypothetical protein
VKWKLNLINPIVLQQVWSHQIERESERERNVGDNNATGWTFKRGVKDYTGGSKHTMLMSE